MNKVVVVTGGASGIGQAVVERLARDDFTGVILDINEEGGKEVAAKIEGRGKQATFIRLDVTREADVQKTFQQIISDHGRIDALVNVAGGSLHRHKIEEFPLDHWQAVIDVNLTSTFLCCRAVIGLMKTSEKRRDCEYFFRHRFQRRCQPLGLCRGQGRHRGILEDVSARARAFRRARQCGSSRHASPPSASGRLTPTPSGKPQPREFPSAMPANRRTSPKPWPSLPAMPADI